MNWYPFDTQVCSMTISVTEDLNDFITIEDNGHENLGPVDLTQYFIRNTEMNINLIGNKQQAVVFKITLGRRLLGTVLTVFLPTILMNVVGHGANYFKAFFFEAVVSVNLTVMLVLTTMFINVSNQLPKTSYIKMMDIWLISNLLLPFMEVLLHTYIDRLRNDEDREVNHHGKTIKPEGNEDMDGEEDKIDMEVSNISQKITQVVPADSPTMINLDLVSRNEKTQVRALKRLYSQLEVDIRRTKNETKLKRCMRFAIVYNPIACLIFVSVYWILGLKHAEYF